jgi:hypothetical protein
MTTVDITAQIQGEVAAGPQTQAALDVILAKYSAADLAAAFPQFGSVADYEAAKNRVGETNNAPAPVPAPPPPPPPIPTATSDTVSLTAQIRGEAAAGPQTQGALNVLLTRYTAEQLAAAFPEFGSVADYQAAKDGLPKGIVVPGTLDAAGRPQFVQGTPEFVQADQIATARSREALLRAARDFGQEGAVSAVVGDKVFLTLPPLRPGDPPRDVDITNYFNGLPKPPVAIDISVPTYGTSTVQTQFGSVSVYALPESPTRVTVNGQSIEINSDSEVAKFLQWQASQPNPAGSGTIGDVWARQGIANPYSDPRLVSQAQQQIDRSDNRTDAFNQAGIVPDVELIAPWNDPNWPSYQGSNKVAFETATAALADTATRNNLMAENGWDLPTFESWALRSTNPTEWGRLAAERDIAAGIVAGPGGVTTSLSPNGATTINTTGQIDSAGFPLSYYETIAQKTNVPLDQVLIAAGISGTAALAGLSGLTSLTGLVDPTTGLPFIPNFSAPNLPSNLAGIAAGFGQGLIDSLPTVIPVLGALQLTAAQVAGLAQAAEDTAAGLIADIRRLPAAIPDSLSPYVTAAVQSVTDAASSGIDAISELLTRQNATIQKAKEQATLQARNNEAAAPDWRVRLQLAPGAQYLYKDPEPGILAPLFSTDGVIFPYTPSIETAYTANYDKYDLTHSNYRGYFYKNSAVNDINIRGTFTAQDTAEAEYVLAVIHFFRSVTKMFYGARDNFRGAPPPLVYLSGYGDFQFNDHPCLVSNFSYSLPDNVDYIRAWAPNNYGNLFSTRATTTGRVRSASSTRLSNSTVTADNGVTIILDNPPAPPPTVQNVNNLTGATYVPTKIEINITLLPTNTRSQVSQQFSVKEFANGNLLKGGFW